MAVDGRDELWNASFETYYDAYYEELLAETLASWWQRIDDITRVLVAVTASSSAIAGWALWNDAQFKTAWAVLAGAGAVLALVHSTLGVQDRLKDLGEVRRRAARLRVALETFRYRMRLDANFSLPEFSKEFVEFRNSFSSDVVQLLKGDVLNFSWLKNRVQSHLDTMLREDSVISSTEVSDDVDKR